MTNGKTLFYTQHRIGCLIKCHSYCFKGPDNFLPEYSNQVILYFLLIEPFCFPPGSFLYPAQSFISHKNNNFYLYVCSFFSIGKCMFQLYSVPSYLTFLGLNTCTYETGIIMVADFTYCLPSNHQLFFLVNWPRSSFPAQRGWQSLGFKKKPSHLSVTSCPVTNAEGVGVWRATLLGTAIL